jgi:hypothetical protein
MKKNVDMPTAMPQDIWSMICACWSPPASRPTAIEVEVGLSQQAVASSDTRTIPKFWIRVESGVNFALAKTSCDSEFWLLVANHHRQSLTGEFGFNFQFDNDLPIIANSAFDAALQPIREVLAGSTVIGYETIYDPCHSIAFDYLELMSKHVFIPAIGAQIHFRLLLKERSSKEESVGTAPLEPVAIVAVTSRLALKTVTVLDQTSSDATVPATFPPLDLAEQAQPTDQLAEPTIQRSCTAQGEVLEKPEVPVSTHGNADERSTLVVYQEAIASMKAGKAPTIRQPAKGGAAAREKAARINDIHIILKGRKKFKFPHPWLKVESVCSACGIPGHSQVNHRFCLRNKTEFAKLPAQDQAKLKSEWNAKAAKQMKVLSEEYQRTLTLTKWM